MGLAAGSCGCFPTGKAQAQCCALPCICRPEGVQSSTDFVRLERRCAYLLGSPVPYADDVAEVCEGQPGLHWMEVQHFDLQMSRKEPELLRKCLFTYHRHACHAACSVQHEPHLQLEGQACACLLGVLILCATTMMQSLIAVRWGSFLNKELICAVTAWAKNRARWLKAVPHLASGWPESFKVQRSHWNSCSRLSLYHRLLPAHTADVYIVMFVPQPLPLLPSAADTLTAGPADLQYIRIGRYLDLLPFWSGPERAECCM